MMTLPLYPVWLIEFFGGAAMIVVAAMCLRVAWKILRQAPENPLANYFFWFCGAIFAFSLSRSLGHMVKHILYLTDRSAWWHDLAPFSGSINTILFVVISSVTLFFPRMQKIIDRVARDRDKIERTSRELLDLNNRLENIVFERTRAEMALRVAHDVRNPAMIIGGLVKRLFKDADLQALPDKERLEKVSEQAEKLESLVAKFERIRPEAKKVFSPLDLNVLVDETIELLQHEADDKGVTLLLDRSPALLVFMGNEQLMKIAIMHLMRNGIEASSYGDTLQITSELGASGIVLRVQDSGPGIPAEVLEHIFEPFYTTKSGGTGLGLPYVKQIIDEHKGALLLRNAAQGGTTAEIVLPTHLGVLRKQELG